MSALDIARWVAAIFCGVSLFGLLLTVTLGLIAPIFHARRARRKDLPPISFVLPIKIGDTCHIEFHVASARASKSRPGWGIVIVPVELINQRGEVVQKGEHRVMVPCKPKD